MKKFDNKGRKSRHIRLDDGSLEFARQERGLLKKKSLLIRKLEYEFDKEEGDLEPVVRDEHFLRTKEWPRHLGEYLPRGCGDLPVYMPWAPEPKFPQPRHIHIEEPVKQVESQSSLSYDRPWQSSPGSPSSSGMRGTIQRSGSLRNAGTAFLAHKLESLLAGNEFPNFGDHLALLVKMGRVKRTSSVQVVITTCAGTKHDYCTWHNHQKYDNYAAKIQNVFKDYFDNAEVFTNPGYESDTASLFPDKNQPPLGAFEVAMVCPTNEGSSLVHVSSKLRSKKWPNTDIIAHSIENALLYERVPVILTFNCNGHPLPAGIKVELKSPPKDEGDPDFPLGDLIEHTTNPAGKVLAEVWVDSEYELFLSSSIYQQPDPIMCEADEISSSASGILQRTVYVEPELKPVMALVKDTRGNPLPQVKVRIEGLEEYGYTDDHGIYTFFNVPVGPDKKRLAVGGDWHGGNMYSSKTVNFVNDPTADVDCEVEVEIEEEGIPASLIFELKVQQSGEPLSNLKVVLQDKYKPEITAEMVTDERGIANFGNMIVGREVLYTVLTRMDDEVKKFKVPKNTLHVIKTCKDEISLSLKQVLVEDFGIAFKVTNKQGQPCCGAILRVAWQKNILSQEVDVEGNTVFSFGDVEMTTRFAYEAIDFWGVNTSVSAALFPQIDKPVRYVQVTMVSNLSCLGGLVLNRSGASYIYLSASKQTAADNLLSQQASDSRNEVVSITHKYTSDVATYGGTSIVMDDPCTKLGGPKFNTPMMNISVDQIPPADFTSVLLVVDNKVFNEPGLIEEFLHTTSPAVSNNVEICCYSSCGGLVEDFTPFLNLNPQEVARKLTYEPADEDENKTYTCLMQGMTTMAQREATRKIAIVMTASHLIDQSDSVSGVHSSGFAKKEGIHVFALHVGRGVKPTPLLKNIANSSTGALWVLDTPNDALMSLSAISSAFYRPVYKVSFQIPQELVALPLTEHTWLTATVTDPSQGKRAMGTQTAGRIVQ